jgi:hypothetical protein
MATNDVLYIAPATNKLYSRSATDLSTQTWASPVTLAANNTAAPYADPFSSPTQIYVAAGNNLQCVADNGSSGAVEWSFDASVRIESGPLA